MGALWLFVNNTKLGLALKGMAQDERAAMTLGIDSDRMAVIGYCNRVHVGGARPQ